ncbi:MAG: diaminopimelate epimerase, partial [Bacteroidota bacterium]
VAFLCDRKFGIGSDGLMMLENADGFDFKMRYFNADGNEGSMCGNGGRCLVQFAHDKGIVKQSYQFTASDGPHEAIILDNGWIKLKMQDVNGIQKNGSDSILNTGSPHFIQYVDGVKDVDVFQQGRSIRYNELFKEAGINVNFVERVGEGIKIRTYERGVENETLSCGTGATAAALASSEKLGPQLTNVEVEGGVLQIEFDRVGEQEFNNIWLIGPTQFVYAGTIEI